jgi:hypothetical protein
MEEKVLMRVTGVIGCATESSALHNSLQSMALPDFAAQLMNPLASTANLAVESTLMMLAANSIEVTGVPLWLREANAMVISQRHGTNSTYAAETSVSARCAGVIAMETTFKSEKLRQKVIGVCGAAMMRPHALQRTKAIETQRDLLESVFAALTILPNDP